MRRTLLAVLLAVTPVIGLASTDANTEFDELYAQAESQASGPQIPPALFQLAQDRAIWGASSFKNMGQLANYLADDFSLYSKTHGEVVRDYCKERGVDITSYLAEFSQEVMADSNVAQKIYARLGISYDEIWKNLKPQASQGAKGLMESFAKTLKVPSGNVCTHLATNPEASAQQLTYSSVRASRSQVLRAISP